MGAVLCSKPGPMASTGGGSGSGIRAQMHNPGRRLPIDAGWSGSEHGAPFNGVNHVLPFIRIDPVPTGAARIRGVAGGGDLAGIRGVVLVDRRITGAARSALAARRVRSAGRLTRGTADLRGPPR